MSALYLCSRINCCAVCLHGQNASYHHCVTQGGFNTPLTDHMRKALEIKEQFNEYLLNPHHDKLMHLQEMEEFERRVRECVLNVGKRHYPDQETYSGAFRFVCAWISTGPNEDQKLHSVIETTLEDAQRCLGSLIVNTHGCVVTSLTPIFLSEPPPRVPRPWNPQDDRYIPF